MARDAHLVAEQRDLDQVLDDDAEHDVVGDLAHARQLALPDVGDASRRERLDQRLDLSKGGLGPRSYR